MNGLEQLKKAINGQQSKIMVYFKQPQQHLYYSTGNVPCVYDAFTVIKHDGSSVLTRKKQVPVLPFD